MGGVSAPAVTIRASRSGDETKVVQVVAGILQSEFSQDQPAYPTDDLERLADSYAGPNSTFLVAEQDARIVGTCGVKAESPQTAILRRLFVSPTCRGKGVGSQLLKEALSFCRKRGFREVIIRTSTRMQQAIRLCMAEGFQEEGRWTLGEVTLIRFRLKLS